MVTIIDYDAGNIRSIVNMLRALGIKSQVSGDPDVIGEAERLILPGVGHFDHGMRALRSRGLLDVLNQRVVEAGIPILGICLGAQLLTQGSEEGTEPGLGWIEARTVAFDRPRLGQGLSVPHMGWADTWSLRDNPLTPGIPPDARFYYVHSYHLVCDHEENAILATHHGYDYTAAIQRANILGVQFHPEKSHRFGMNVLKSFLAWSPANVLGAA
jgi:glutamine amidotransferase